MAGQQFQYDDSGNTFFYFLTSFVGLIVIPATYYLWPRDQNAGESRWQLPADPLRPRRPLRAAPRRFSPARRVRGDTARAAGPRVHAPATGAARARCCPRCLSGLLSTTLHCPALEFLFFPHCSEYSLLPPPASLSSLSPVLVGICLYGGSRMGWGGWELGGEKRVGKGGREGTSRSPQATIVFLPHAGFPAAAVVTDVLGTV